jgi:pyruvate dehydrogenase E2 component (dihydrolipoamide acetyltransferase)
MSDFHMPSLGADMAFGTVIEWRVKPGDAVARGDIVALVDTEKAAIEVEIFESGVVEELVVPPGTRVPVGAVLARLRPLDAAAVPSVAEAPALRAEGAADETGVQIPSFAARPSSVAEAPMPGAAPPTAFPGGLGENGQEGGEAEGDEREKGGEPGAVALPPRGSTAEPHVRSSPAARALASELGIDLANLTGTGPEGAVVRDDVAKAAKAKLGIAAAGEVAARTAEAEEHIHISPLARRVAEELEVDLATVPAHGKAGRITRADVERAAAERAGVGAPVASSPEMLPAEGAGVDRQRAMRQAIAAAVTRSKREIPHYYLGTRIDMSRALDWLEQANRERPVADRILPAALLLRATALALRDFPELNGFWLDDAFRAGEGIHPGVAIFLRGGGLIAPAILDADKKGLTELMSALSDLVRRARSGGLRGSELTAGTVTVTNLGDRGAESVFGVIYPPQVAILGFGRIAEEPWAEIGMLAVRPVVHVSLAADHRASDGHRGSLFLGEIGRLLQNPEEL